MFFCGLDFGTSNSTVGVWQNGKPQLAPLEGDKTVLPSAIFFDTEEHLTSFGRFAMSEYIDGAEGRLMRALKSVLGTSLIDDKTRVGNKSLSFQEIIGVFIGHMKQKAEAHVGQSIEHVVLGRPVFFVDNNPEADKKAANTLESIARQQGFKHVQFQYEPVAAALDFEQTVTSEKIALIIDIGGGTSDFSVVRVSPEGRNKADRFDDVLSNTGVHIGGTDFDKKLSLNTVMPELGYGTYLYDEISEQDLELPALFYRELATWQKINFLYTTAVFNDVKDIRRTAYEKEKVERLMRILEDRKGHALALEVEGGKIALTESETAKLNLSFAEKGFSLSIERQQLQNAIEADIQSLQHTVTEALQQAGVTSNQIDTVFLTGGSTMIPAVKNTLLNMLPNAETIDGDTFGSIGTGLTLDAKRRFGG